MQIIDNALNQSLSCGKQQCGVLSHNANSKYMSEEILGYSVLSQFKKPSKRLLVLNSQKN